MKLNSLLSCKKLGLLAALLFFSAVGTHAASLESRGHYLGGELGYNGFGSYIHLGFRYVNPYQVMKGKVLLDLQAVAGLGTGYGQVLRLDGGFNFGIGSDINNVAFSFVILGISLQLNLNVYYGFGAGIGPSIMLPFSTNVYWEKFLFALHWGIDPEWHINSDGTTYHNYFFFRLVVGYKF